MKWVVHLLLLFSRLGGTLTDFNKHMSITWNPDSNQPLHDDLIIWTYRDFSHTYASYQFLNIQFYAKEVLCFMLKT